MKNKSPIAWRIVSLILLIGWMGLIFYLSHQNADNSSQMSSGLIEGLIKFFFPDISNNTLESIVESLQFIVRKTAHFVIYAILGIFSFMTFITYESINLSLRLALSLSVSMLYASGDEYHQTFIVGRSGELRDIFIDSLGALTGIIFALIIYKISKAIKSKGRKKMRKKQYAELTDTLTQRLNMEKKHSEELEEENSLLNRELSALKERIIALENQAEQKNSEVTNEPIAETEIPEKIINEPSFSDGITAGAKTIGKIVLSSAEYCNRLTGACAGENAKELVNLILGRTEVAKGEILRLSALQIDPADRQLAMERELNEAEDYFKSVMAQKSF